MMTPDSDNHSVSVFAGNPTGFKRCLAIAAALLCVGLANAGEPPFFIRAQADICEGTGALVQPLPPTMKARACHSSLKPIGIVVMDVEPTHPAFSWACRMVEAGPEKAIIDHEFRCGYVLTSTIVDANNRPVSRATLEKAAATSSMKDVHRMGKPAVGCLIDDKVKWC